MRTINPKRLNDFRPAVAPKKGICLDFYDHHYAQNSSKFYGLRSLAKSSSIARQS
jgi:hypothetical protein